MLFKGSNSDHYSGIERSENTGQSPFFARTEGQFLKELVNVSRQELRCVSQNIPRCKTCLEAGGQH
jgi:hypothetical protein